MYIAEDLNCWLTTEDGDGFKVEGESGGCKDLKDFNKDAKGEFCILQAPRKIL